MTPMGYPRRHVVILAVTTIVLLAGMGLMAAAAPADTAKEVRHKSGISLVGPGPYQPRPANKAQADAYHHALRAAQENPEQLGYPWLDAQGHLVQRNTTPKGLELALKVDAAIPRRTEAAQQSYGQLEEIKNEIIFLDQAGVPGANVIWKTQPDEEHNRIIVTVSRLDDALMAQLAKTYGTRAIAVHVKHIAHRSGLVRYADTKPYSAGAAYDPPSGVRCTLGFAFTTGFITAGHCADTGGISSTIWDSFTKIGTTEEFYEENWRDDIGTVSFPGEANVYRGDIALIKTTASALQRPRIYIGTEDSTLTRNVSSMWWSESSVGDRYCTGGSTTGELCDWEVTAHGVNYKPNSTQHWLHVTEGYRYGRGVEGGDSGGSVYTYNWDGSISAKGIINAKHDDWAPHYYGYFTEIIQAYLYFPGVLKTGGRTSLVLNDNSNMCLDVKGASSTNGANIIQYTCHGGSNQQWYWESHPSTGNAIKIVNAAGKCLAIGSSSTANGAKAIQWDCIDSSSGQTWYFGANGSLINGSGKCLAIGSGSLVEGANAIQWECLGSPAQRWNWNAF